MQSVLLFIEKRSEFLHATLRVSLIENPQPTRTRSSRGTAGVRINYGEQSSTT